MQHVLTPYAAPIEPFAWWEGAFSDQELDWLQGKAIRAKQRAQVGGSPTAEELDLVRRSKVAWMPKNEETTWVFERLANIASDLNAKYFRFDLVGFGEPLQLTNYDQSDHGMYGWHQDFNATVSRKLSLVVQLSDPATYEGGNLELQTGAEPITIKKQRGLVVAFPAYCMHQVTPVVSGSRQSLVAWITGPAFK